MTEGRAKAHPTDPLEAAASPTDTAPYPTEAAPSPARASTSPTEVAAHPADVFRRDRLTWLAYLMLGYYGYLINGIGPSIPGLRDDLAVGFGVASLHGSLFAVGMILAGLVGDRVVAAVGRRTAFWVAAGGMAVATWVLASARALAITLPAALAMGTIGSLLIILIPAILSDRHGVHRSTAYAEANSISSAAGAVAPLVIGAAIFAGLGWGPGLAVVPTILLLVLVVAFGSTPFPGPVGPIPRMATGSAAESPTGPSTGSSPRSAEGGVGDRRTTLGAEFRWHWATLVLVVAVEFCMVFWAADYLRTEIGLPPAAAATSVAAFLAAMVVGRAVGGRVALGIAPDRLLVRMLGLTGVGFAVFWSTGLAVPSVVGLGLTGLGVAMLYPLALALTVGSAPGASDLASARSALGSGVAVGLAPLVLGWTADLVGLHLAYLIVPVLLVVGLATVRLGPRTAASARGSGHGAPGPRP